MIRRYRPDPLPQDAVERIIAAALHVPSAGFSQGIDVTAVLQPEMRRRVVVEALNNEPDSPLLDAPLLLIITADEERYHRRYNEPDKLAVGGGQEIGWPVPYWYVDAGSAMMLALLPGSTSAHDADLNQRQSTSSAGSIPADWLLITGHCH